MTKYLKVTDDESIGYHSVEDNYRPPRAEAHETYEFVDEAEAREKHPALFGPPAEDPKPAK